MTKQLGNFSLDSTVYVRFWTFDLNDEPTAPSSAFDVDDFRIYKNGNATQRSDDSGITVTSPFDSVTGFHQIEIDLSDDADAGFYSAGDFSVELVTSKTVDGRAIGGTLATFSIENRHLGNNLSAAQVNAEVDTALSDISLNLTYGALSTINATVNSILTDTGTTIPAQITALNDISVDDVWEYDLSGLLVLNSSGFMLDNLHSNQGNWLTATGFSTHSAADVYTEFTSGSNEDSFKADTSSLATLVALNDTANLITMATASQIGALNDISAADVNAEVDSALADYDGPTKVEMDAAFSTQDMLITATMSAIAALNDISVSEIMTQLDSTYSTEYEAMLRIHDTLEDNGGTFRFTEDALSQGNNGLSGLGVYSIDVKVTKDGGTPVDGAAVWVTTDEAGSNVVAGPKYSNSNGWVVPAPSFKVDAGTYWVHFEKSGVNISSNQITVNADDVTTSTTTTT